MLYCSILVHAYFIRARDLINQLAKKLINSLTIALVRRVKVKARSQKQNVISPWR